MDSSFYFAPNAVIRMGKLRQALEVSHTIRRAASPEGNAYPAGGAGGASGAPVELLRILKEFINCSVLGAGCSLLFTTISW